MRILTYKRTHKGDPDPNGRFGSFNCMGRVRSYHYDAVIGVGGVGREAKSHQIDHKINWVGIGPKRHANGTVTFDHFRLFEDSGPPLSNLAPNLANRIFGRNVRILIDGYTPAQEAEAKKILKWSRTAVATKLSDLYVPNRRTGCRSKRKKCKPKTKC